MFRGPGRGCDDCCYYFDQYEKEEAIERARDAMVRAGEWVGEAVCRAIDDYGGCAVHPDCCGLVRVTQHMIVLHCIMHKLTWWCCCAA